MADHMAGVGVTGEAVEIDPEAAYAVPNDGLVRVTPEQVGMSSAAVLAFLDELASNGVEMNSFMLSRHGKVAAEGWWWPYRPDRVHMLHSVTKALTSTGIGLAVSEKYFRLDDRVISFFPDRLPAHVPPNLAEMTVEHLLTQTSGHAHGVSGSVWRGIATSWVDEFFKIPVPYKPGEHFTYSSATSFMLSAIVTRTTGLSLADYLKPRFLDPLGITGLRWDTGPEGINPGGNGVSATTSDFLKIMGVFAGRGRWRNTQLLPEDWVDRVGQSAYGNPYGYHWWVSPDGSGFYAFGAFGQYGFVFPELEVVLVTTAAVPGSISRPDKILPPLVWKHVPKMCKPARNAEDSPPRLGEVTRRLRLLPRLRPRVSPRMSKLHSRRFVAETNEDGVEAISLVFKEGRCEFTVETNNGAHKIEIGLQDWLEGETSMPGVGLHHGYEPKTMRVVAGGEWLENDLFEMRWQFVETAFRDTVRIGGTGDTLTYDRAVNVNGKSVARPQIVAHASEW